MNTVQTHAPSVPIQSLSAQSLGAGLIGNVLEWYDFGLYGYLAPLIGAQFFPDANPVASLIGAYGGFAIGFAMRPVGGAVLGHVGDRVGRRAVMIASVVLMGLATTLIGLLPTYAQVGLWAPVLLIGVRMLQGFSVGGEFTGSVAYLIETAPDHRRGLAGSFANIGGTAGYLLAAGLAALTVMAMNHHPENVWVWRLPFIGGGVLAILAYWLRSRLVHPGYQPDTDAGRRKLPLLQAFEEAPRAMGLVVLFTWGYGVVDYLTMVFLPAFASRFGQVAEGPALAVNTAAIGAAIVIIPLAGWLTDRAIRRRSLLILAFALVGLGAVFLFTLAKGPELARFAIAQVGFALLLGAIMGAGPAMLAEQFAARYRLSGYSLAFSVGLGLGGGTAPLIATALIGATKNALAAPLYLMAGALLSVAALCFMADRSRAPLP